MSQRVLRLVVTSLYDARVVTLKRDEIRKEKEFIAFGLDGHSYFRISTINVSVSGL